MPNFVNARAACYLDGVTVAAQDLRDGANALMTFTGQSNTSGIACTPGVRPTAGSPLFSAWSSGMSFNLNAGVCWVQGTASATAGLWPLILDTTTLLTVTTSDPTNPRIDSVIAVVVDNGNNTSTAQFKILAGTPAGSPVQPTLPANALRLANIAVGAGVSALSSGNFTDLRTYTSALGGILLAKTAALGTTFGGGEGSYVHETTTGRLRVLDGAGVVAAPKVAPFDPQALNIGGTTTLTTNPQTLLSISFTPDTRAWMAIASIGGVYETSATVGDAVTFNITYDGSNTSSGQLSYVQTNTSVAVIPGPGGTLFAVGSGTAAAHTIALVASPSVTGKFVITSCSLCVFALPS
jgi:hypothetical protein